MRLPLEAFPELNPPQVMVFNRMAASLGNSGDEKLVSDLTHELRTPLTVMRGYLEELASSELELLTEIYQDWQKPRT